MSSAIAENSLDCLRCHVADEDGSMTVFGLFVCLWIAVVGAFALDVANLYAARTHLQIAADQAAHAAIYNRNTMDSHQSKIRAIEVVNETLPLARFGSVMQAADIEFGTFDRESDSFVPDANSLSAVRVRASFLRSRENAVESYLFRLIGFDVFDIRQQAIYTTYRPGCLREGFIAEGVVDIQSNNGFTRGFCIHSNTYVSLNSNNFFEPGTIVSMPDLAALDLPKSGFESNDGLEAALRTSRQNIRVLNRVETIIRSYELPGIDVVTPDLERTSDYLTSNIPVSLVAKDLSPLELLPGRIYHVDCIGPRLTVDASAVLREVVLVSPCEIKFAAGSVLEDVVIISKSTAADAINAPAGLQVGRNDNCAPGGGAQLITRGGMNFAADLQMYGGQLIALGNIEFAANANGIQGASMISGGTISGTSNMDMGFCGTGMEDNFEVDYYRLAY